MLIHLTERKRGKRGKMMARTKGIIMNEERIFQAEHIARTARQIASEFQNFEPLDVSFPSDTRIPLVQVWNRVADLGTGNAESAHELSDAYLQMQHE
jgi:hypothetical protein